MFIGKYLTLLVLLCAVNSNAQQSDNNITRNDSMRRQIFKYVEQMPTPGYGFNTYIDDHLQFPDAARVAKMEGRVITEFIVNEDGSISAPRILRGLGGGCDEEALKLLQNMPRWVPGKQGGVPVKVLCTLPITFKLTEEDLKLPEITYMWVDQMPSPGYDIGEYLNHNLHYPDSAREAGIEGRVLISFIVNEDGSILKVRAKHRIGGGCDEEALRVIKGMPKWRPGKQKDAPVAVCFNLPIVFKLTDENEKESKHH